MIYFIQGTQTRNIKIGHTDLSVKSRMNTMQSSDKLICLKTIEGEDEKPYQEMFKHLWLHGEWFASCTDLLKFIDSLPTGPYDNLMQSGLSPWNRHSTNKGTDNPFKGKRMKEHCVHGHKKTLETTWSDGSCKLCASIQRKAKYHYRKNHPGL